MTLLHSAKSSDNGHSTDILIACRALRHCAATARVGVHTRFVDRRDTRTEQASRKWPHTSTSRSRAVRRSTVRERRITCIVLAADVNTSTSTTMKKTIIFIAIDARRPITTTTVHMVRATEQTSMFIARDAKTADTRGCTRIAIRAMRLFCITRITRIASDAIEPIGINIVTNAVIA